MPIALRLTLLAALLAGLSVYVVSELSLRVGQAVLTDQKLDDLGDQCNLRRCELREDLRFLAHEVRTLAGQLTDQLNDLAHHQPAGQVLRADSFRQTFRQRFDRLTRDPPPDTLQALRRRDLDRATFLEAALLEVADADDIHPVRVLRTGDKAQGAAARRWADRPLVPAAFADLRRTIRGHLVARASERGGLAQQYQSRVHRVPGSDPTRYALALGYPLLMQDVRPTAVLAITVDFTRMLHLQARRQPRLLMFVTDPAGHFLFHPDLARVGSSIRDESAWPEHPLLDWKSTDLERNRGAQFTGVPLPGLAFHYAKKKLDGGFAREEHEELNAALARLAEQDPSFRFRELTAGSAHVELSSTDPARLEEARRLIDERERSAGVRGAPWDREILCRTFAVRLLNVSTDAAGEEPPLGLLLAESHEELTADIDAAMARVRYRWATLVLAVACLLALGVGYVLTRPLTSITAASQRLAAGDYSVELPVRGPGEVGELARSFCHMVDQLRKRDQELHNNLARLDTILAGAADGIITFDERGLIEQANEAAENMFGYPHNGLGGRRVQALMDLPPRLLEPVDANSPGGTVRMVHSVLQTAGEIHRGRRRDGSLFWMEVTFSQVPLGDRRLTVGIFRDTTVRRAAEEQIRRLNDELEARVQLRTAQLEDAKGKLEVALEQARAASAAKDRFISVVSHELRTPLTAIKGYTELLLNPRATKLRENPEPTLTNILTASKHLVTLINDLLDVSRYTAGQSITLGDPTTFNLNTFLAGVLDMTRPLAKKNANQLEVHAPPDLGTVRTDETRLRQVLLNLLSNACKFTEKGRVTLEARREKTPPEGPGARTGLQLDDADWVLFIVSDTGIGLTAEQMVQLFQPFYRVDNSTTRKAGGTGLGLAITKIICELMGGSIHVNSDPGKGSTFIVRVPAVLGAVPPRVNRVPPERANVQGTSAPGPASAEHEPSVLVIDDDPAARHLLEDFLEQEGYVVHTAASGEVGVRLARQIYPSTITLDVQMPGQDGWATLTALKTDPATLDIPVVMLTIVDDRGRGYLLGAAEYLTKPVDWDRLRAVLRRHSGGAATPTVLVVEDDPLQCDYLREALALVGWRVLEAGNGREGLEQLQKAAPQLILLDLMMPVMDGFEFLAQLRRLPAPHPPVVVLTARVLSKDERRRLDGSVAQVLGKDAMSCDELLARLRKLLRREATPAL
jgi:PAS domain S-box-containing protein